MTVTTRPMIAFEHVSKTYARSNKPAVRDVSLTVEQGETLVLLGSSGSGKSTLLRLINRLTEPTSGRVRVGGDDVATLDPVRLRRRMGYVFQGIGLFPHFDVTANVAVQPRLLGWPKAKRARRTRELLELVGLDPAVYAHRFPDELSGGQQQRVGVARALAGDPEFLLMDEPFGALDAITRSALQREFVQLQQRLRKTIVFVTHDIQEGMLVGNRIAVMHEGRLEQIGGADELMRTPRTNFVRELFAQPAAAGSPRLTR
jgi:osmoprotectant transport system ATP-binding protein